MAENNARPGVRTSGELLVAPVVVSGKSPAVISLQVGELAVSAQSLLELSVAPEKVSSKEAYLIVVSTADGEREQLGSFSFFPPPRSGEARNFLVRLPSTESLAKAGKSGRINLSVAMVSASPDQPLTVSTARIVSARIVSG